MKLDGKVAVVTGAAGGIGAATAKALAVAGARVVVSDLDLSAVAGTARGIEEAGGTALAVEADAADPASIKRLIDAAMKDFGPVDLFHANAGVIDGEGLGDEAAWQLALEVNVMAHVRAAQALLPAWLERGEGYFASTASAAGLLTQIGQAPYSVSKHAAVGFAEWLAVTYGGRGIRVSCVCPMGVATAMHAAGLAAEGDQLVAARVVQEAGAILTPEEVAAIIVAGIEEERFLIVPHPEVLAYSRGKAEDTEAWIGGMRRLQARIVGGISGT